MDATMLSLDLKQRYEQQAEKVGTLVPNLTGEYVQTPFGPVWVMKAGADDAPPLLLLHGLHTSAPFCIEFFAKLAEKYHVICPDIPGQAGKTPGMAPISSNQAYAIWFEGLLDSLNIESCPAVGLSFGGAVLLDLATRSPNRITMASLVVPAGFFRPIWRPLKKLFMPFLSFKLNTDQLHFDQLMKPLMGDNWPELESYYFAVFQAGIPMTLLPPGPFEKQDLQAFQAPVQLIVATDDLYFAPSKVEKCARTVVPNLSQVIEIEDLHMPSIKNRERIQDQVLEFMLKESRV
ncbi:MULTISPECIES: alpha/beta fold hydrolase [unclassified Neptuniibacter]|jgi:pimeloyl-ACP methyl ester carboxylesterase|uniref:alpha/beta fold hydrolase n=1 Tax=unclassified Neptuniibacter TaxID=2630693 RepID=UPI0026E318E5|nr:MULTISPECIES: alpha/beta hydrolase [unclassified Neptuniibacter]MDO6513503.1 alpha/beta hydrolase [Neptuniibacter sp. 2_MG-2023]MDO6594032.1 alpha/beta hydrolase [Neptuniibacter sp. 1_MG-2023]